MHNLSNCWEMDLRLTHPKFSYGAVMYGRKCRCCPATPQPKCGVLLLHYILYIPAFGYGKLDPRLSWHCRLSLRTLLSYFHKSRISSWKRNSIGYLAHRCLCLKTQHYYSSSYIAFATSLSTCSVE